MCTVEEDANYIITQNTSFLDELSGKSLLITGTGGSVRAYFMDILAYYNQKNFETPVNVLAAANFLSDIPQRLQAFADVSDRSVMQPDALEPLGTNTRFDYIIHVTSLAPLCFVESISLKALT